MCVGEMNLDKKLTKALAGTSKKISFSLLKTADSKVALITPIGIFQGTISDKILRLDILSKLHEFTIKEPEGASKL